MPLRRVAVRQHSLEVPGGILVLTIEPGSPAERAGLGAGDVIVALNGQPVAGIDDLHRLLGTEVIGAKLPITVVRGAEKRDLEITPDDA